MCTTSPSHHLTLCHSPHRPATGGGGSSGGITPDALIPRLRALAKDKGVAAVVLRVDSPGGDALASDLLWREIQVLGDKKPVVASMGDTAGGWHWAGGQGVAAMAHSVCVAAVQLYDCQGCSSVCCSW